MQKEKIPKKPVMPKKEMKPFAMPEDEEVTLEKVLKWANEYQLDPKDVIIELDCEGYYDTSLCVFTMIPETKEDFQEKINKYKIKLETYNKWAMEKSKNEEERKNAEIEILEKRLEKLRGK